MELKNRNEIEEKYKFDLSEFCRDNDDFYKRVENVKKDIVKLSFYKGKLGNPETLLKYFQHSDQVYSEIEILDGYAMLLFDVDNLNNENIKMREVVERVLCQYAETTSFADEEMRNLGEDYLQKVADNAKFVDYKMQLEKFVEKLSHTLPEHDEIILSQIAGFTNYAKDSNGYLNGEMHIEKVADSDGNLHEMNVATYSQFLKSKDRVLRKNAYMAMAEAISKSKNTLFSFVANDMKYTDFVNNLRNYESVLEEELTDNDLPQVVFERILSKAREYGYLKKKYQQSVKKILGYDELMPWDMSVNLSSYNDKITFEDAQEKLLTAFECLGNVYTDSLKRAVAERWFDVFSNKGKSSAIYCMSIYAKTPRIHFNWEGDVEDVLTFAHEFGHGVQSLITHSKQPYSMCAMPWCLVEVPSLTAETVAYLSLVNNAKSDEEKLSCMQRFLRTLRANIFTGTKDAEIEKTIRDDVRAGEVIDVETISNRFENFDTKNTIIKNEEKAKYNWLIDDHIFYPYYNYNYSLDMLIACYFAPKIYAGDKKALNDFYKLMESGGSKRTMEILSESGINLLNNKIYDEAFAFFESTLNEFDALANKIMKSDCEKCSCEK